VSDVFDAVIAVTGIDAESQPERRHMSGDGNIYMELINACHVGWQINTKHEYNKTVKSLKQANLMIQSQTT
jgi:hypothetical protein